MTFRRLTESEREKLKDQREKGKLSRVPKPDAKVKYQTFENFTLAVVKNGRNLLVGISKRNPVEPNNESVAHEVAIVRAFRSSPVLTI